MLAILDSTVLIDFLRGRPAVERVGALRTAGDVPATTAVNVEEIFRGLRPGEEGSVQALVAGLVVLPIDDAVARIAGTWRRDHASRGITLWQADCLVAAAASHHDGRLYTGNPKDFPMIDVEHWPVGQ